MKKEFVVAIFLGLVVGLLIVVGIVIARQAFEKHQAGSDDTNKSSPISTSLSSGTPTATPTPLKHSITIDQPDNNSVASSSELMISGKTTPQSTIAIVSEKNEYFTSADEAGLFSQKIELITGVNEIKMVSLAPNEEQAEITLTVVYTTAEF
ncbi:MAG: hypothetical protein UV19_C0023G0004 [Parcubacteria group bacterium GW2011_GWA2_42_28]|nr:MAG: hypothetical protein UV19_C0023G0004 [Parcubacteria group bacterium GW2011_GWA2_42_28]